MKQIKDLKTNFMENSSKNIKKLVKIHVTAEEMIIDQQIREIAHLIEKPGVLPLEHIKALEILVKTKKLIQNNSPINADNDPKEELSTEELLNIAGKTENEPTESGTESSEKDPLG